MWRRRRACGKPSGRSCSGRKSGRSGAHGWRSAKRRRGRRNPDSSWLPVSSAGSAAQKCSSQFWVVTFRLDRKPVQGRRSAMSQLMIDTNGAAIRAVESGAGEPALIFLHYWGGSSRTWAGVIDRLAGEARCVALDQRGWGTSIATDGRYDLATMADDVEAVAQRLGLSRFVLVGHSMGGKSRSDCCESPARGPCGSGAPRACPADANAGPGDAARRNVRFV
jgi:alpha/beta hydrolase fold